MMHHTIPAIVISTLIFSIIYGILGNDHIYYVDHKNTFINNLYFSSITQTLLGDPDMKPKTPLAKFVVALQAFMTFLFLYFPIYLYIK